MEEGQELEETGEVVTERARIAGVEAGIAAGLVPSSQAVGAPFLRAGRGPFRVDELRCGSGGLWFTVTGRTGRLLRSA